MFGISLPLASALELKHTRLHHKRDQAITTTTATAPPAASINTDNECGQGRAACVIQNGAVIDNTGQVDIDSSRKAYSADPLFIGLTIVVPLLVCGSTLAVWLVFRKENRPMSIRERLWNLFHPHEVMEIKNSHAFARRQIPPRSSQLHSRRHTEFILLEDANMSRTPST